MRAHRLAVKAPKAAATAILFHLNVVYDIRTIAAAIALLASSAAVAAPSISSCPVFPPDNIWNTRIDNLPVDASSDAFVESIGSDEAIHADFGAALYEGAPIGIPYIVVPKDQPKADVIFKGFGDEPDAFPDESDPGPYPIPADAPIEGGIDSQGD
eukprot:gene67291-92180_t